MHEIRWLSREIQFVFSLLIGMVSFFASTTSQAQRYAYPWAEKALDQRISVRYEHVDLGYVYEQVRHLGCQAFVPFRLRNEGDLTISSRSITIRELFERLAESGGLTIEYLNGDPVFSKPITDERFNELRAEIRDPDSSGRALALDEMLKTVEHRVYPELFWVMAHGDIDSARKAFTELHSRAGNQSGWGSKVSLRHLNEYQFFLEGIHRVAKQSPVVKRHFHKSLFSRNQVYSVLFSAPETQQNRFRRLYPDEATLTFGGPQRIPDQTFPQLLELMTTAEPVPLPTGGCPVGNQPPPINRGEVVRAMIKCDKTKAVEFLTKSAKTLMAGNVAVDSWPVTVCEGLVDCESDLATEFASFCYGAQPVLDAEKASNPRFSGFTMRTATDRLLKSLIVANDEKFLETIGEFLSDENAHIRALAIHGLARTGEARAALPLEDLLKKKNADDDGLEMIQIVQGLAMIGAVETTERFAAKLNEKKHRELAIYYLACVGDPRGDKLLKELYNSKNETLLVIGVSWAETYHEFALAELAKIGDRVALDELEQRMYDSVSGVEPQGYPVPSKFANRDLWAYLTYSSSVNSAARKLSPENSDAARVAAARSLVVVNPVAHSIKKRLSLFDKESIAILKRAARKDRNSEVRKIARWIIHMLKQG